MPLRPAKRLPKRFSRPVSRETKRMVRRQRKSGKKQRWSDSFHRVQRRGLRSLASWRRSILKWLIVVFVGLFLLVCGLAVFSPIIQVREIRVTRTNARLDIEEVQRILAPIFERHLLFLQRLEVSQMLMDVLPDVQEIEISKQYPSVLFVRITLEPLHARLRILDPDISPGETGTGSVVDFLTDRGVYVTTPFVENPEALPLVHLVDWGVRPVEGTMLLKPQFLEIVHETERALAEQFGHRITQRTVFLRAQEYHLRVDDGVDLWFDAKSPLDDHLQRYRTFLRNVDLGEVEEYIDLRLSDRVVYK